MPLSQEEIYELRSWIGPQSPARPRSGRASESVVLYTERRSLGAHTSVVGVRLQIAFSSGCARQAASEGRKQVPGEDARVVGSLRFSATIIMQTLAICSPERRWVDRISAYSQAGMQIRLLAGHGSATRWMGSNPPDDWTRRAANGRVAARPGLRAAGFASSTVYDDLF